jgi:hypothetical protein
MPNDILSALSRNHLNQSPVQDRSPARYTCHVQLYGPETVAISQPLVTQPLQSSHRRRTVHLRVTPATSKCTVLKPSPSQPLVSQPPHQSPAQDRSLARYTCHVQVYGPETVAIATPCLATTSISRGRRTVHLRVTPATSKCTVLKPSPPQPLVSQPPQSVTGAGPFTRALHLPRPSVRS